MINIFFCLFVRKLLKNYCIFFYIQKQKKRRKKTKNNNNQKTKNQITEERNMESKKTRSLLRPLLDTWTLWAHLPQDPNYTITSYIKIITFNTVEEALAIMKILPSNLIQSCMLFLMRNGTTPLYEDKNNSKGGAFSYKVFNEKVVNAWNHLFLVVIGETVSESSEFTESVSGITISPKTNFCIIKIWLKNCNHLNAAVVTKEISHNLLSPINCNFKPHF